MKLHYLNTTLPKPQRFTFPFSYQPHPICQLAAKETQDYIARHETLRTDADKGKMFGVLVVETADGRLAFLAAYSGLLAGRNDWPWFVPPVFDAQQPDGHFKQTERAISAINRQLQEADDDALRERRRLMSEELQEWLFRQYRMLNARGERRDMVELWRDYYSRPKMLRKFPLPPAGTGDCCAPKLLQYAYSQQLRPVCMAEFWWGAPTKTELRRHLCYYPACRGKCKPILTWMLQGLDVDPDPESLGFPRLALETVYEDDYLLVVNKPAGLLSSPGRIEQYSVETIMRERYPGAIIAHRLDMPTSGLLIVAKSLEVYRPLQEQFVRREVKKKYVARLEKSPGSTPRQAGPEGDRRTPPPFAGRPAKGRIELPLRPDPMNRPRQVVDLEHGKRAVTDYELIGDDVVVLWPHTGRTHQLRIHCAHPDGLGRPIVGDELYGTPADRLCLYATEIQFRHPVTGAAMHFVLPFPFSKPTCPNNK